MLTFIQITPMMEIKRESPYVASTLFKMSVAAAANSHSPRNKRENVCDQQQQASTAHGTNVRMSVDSEVERVSGRSPQTQLGESRDTMGDRAACTVQVTPRVFSISLRIWAEPADATQREQEHDG